MISLYRKDVLGILYSPYLHLPEPPQILWNHRKMSMSFSQYVLGILYSPDLYLPEPPQILWNHRKMSMNFSQCVTCSVFLLPFC
ncbi:hypothetical protein XELAEV_18019595mg [Xenopus laevis]|uniref:Uncharacterized protein n=1 Tax=Xenopus laevis TaxID=8355 RepID=A0A974HV19_XENLA|nr:hypothetical protein XELAEV_18019595mg [Xenopus laevis]